MIRMHELDKPYWEHERGRWLCSNTSDAAKMVLEHPGDTVYLYDRDLGTGKMVNIRMYWSAQMPDLRRGKIIKGGKLRK